MNERMGLFSRKRDVAPNPTPSSGTEPLRSGAGRGLLPEPADCLYDTDGSVRSHLNITPRVPVLTGPGGAVAFYKVAMAITPELRGGGRFGPFASFPWEEASSLWAISAGKEGCCLFATGDDQLINEHLLDRWQSTSLPEGYRADVGGRTAGYDPTIIRRFAAGGFTSITQLDQLDAGVESMGALADPGENPPGAKQALFAHLNTQGAVLALHGPGSADEVVALATSLTPSLIESRAFGPFGELPWDSESLWAVTTGERGSALFVTCTEVEEFTRRIAMPWMRASSRTEGELPDGYTVDLCGVGVGGFESLAATRFNEGLVVPVWNLPGFAHLRA